MSGSVFYYQLTWNLECVCFACTVYRVSTFLRINRQLFVLWQTLYMVLKKVVFVLSVTTPIFAALVIAKHLAWSSYAENYRTSMVSVSSWFITLMVDGRRLPAAITSRHTTALFEILFYVFFDLLLRNLWIAVIVFEYQKVRVTCGYKCENYRWHELDWAKWILFKSFFPKYMKMRRLCGRDLEKDVLKPTEAYRPGDEIV